jgi:hypothetical protein
MPDLPSVSSLLASCARILDDVLERDQACPTHRAVGFIHTRPGEDSFLTRATGAGLPGFCYGDRDALTLSRRERNVERRY